MNTANDNSSKPKLSLNEMRKRIAKLSGRAPVSTDERYLALRLEQLEAKKANGEDTRSRRGDEPHEPVTISLTRSARDGVRTLADKLAKDVKRGVTVSELVQRALGVYAESVGEKTLARRAFGVGGES